MDFLEIGSSGSIAVTLCDKYSFDIGRSNGHIYFDSKNCEPFCFYDNVYVKKNLSVEGKFMINGGLNITSNISVSGSQTVQEYLTVQQDVNVGSNVGIGNNLVTKGSITTDNCITLSNISKNTHWKILNTFSEVKNESELTFISNSGTTTQFTDTLYESLLNFTGSHTVSTIISNNDFNEDLIGHIVISTGKYQDLDNSEEIRISEAIPIVALSIKEKDTRIFGVIADFEEKNKNTRQFKIGTLVFNKDKKIDDIKLVIHSHGEGGLLVCDYNGSISNGDLLCTSPIPGLAMKQDDDIIRSYTVGKATSCCNFKDIYPKSKIGLKNIQFKKKKYKKCLIGVLYSF